MHSSQVVLSKVKHSFIRNIKKQIYIGGGGFHFQEGKGGFQDPFSFFNTFFGGGGGGIHFYFLVLPFLLFLSSRSSRFSCFFCNNAVTGGGGSNFGFGNGGGCIF